jgi:hypothetical protein
MLLIGYFIGFRAFALIHHVAHSQENSHHQQTLESKSDLQEFAGKQFSQKSKNDEDDCLICHLFDFYQNNILLLFGLVLFLILLRFSKYLAPPNKIKISYSSFSCKTRAPPIFVN